MNMQAYRMVLFLVIVSIAVGGIAYAVLSDSFDQLPFIFAVVGAALGLLAALLNAITEYAQGEGEPESWWGLIVFPLLGLLSMYVFALVIVIAYYLVAHGTWWWELPVRR